MLEDLFYDISVLDEKRLLDLEELDDDEFTFFALPLDIRGRDDPR